MFAIFIWQCHAALATRHPRIRRCEKSRPTIDEFQCIETVKHIMSGFATTRYIGLDFARSIACIGIIWIHTVSTSHVGSIKHLGRFAVPFFSVSSLFLLIRSKKASTFVKESRQRLVRLLVPFAFWSLLYIGFMNLAAYILGNPPPIFGIDILWTGPTHHLWFCPYLAAVSTIACWIKFSDCKEYLRNYVGSITLLVLTVILCEIAQRNYPLDGDYTLRLSIDTLPAAVFGILLGLSDDKSIKWFFEIRPFILVWLIAGFTTYLLTVGRSLTVENAFGVTVFLLAMNTCLEVRWPVVLKLLASAGGLSFGVYFIHVLYVEGLQDLFHLLHVAPGVQLDLLVFVLSCFLSVFSMFVCVHLLPAKVARWIGAI